MKQSEQINELAAALCKFQGDMPTLPKDASGYGYKYTPLDTVVEAIKQRLFNVGLSFVQMPTHFDNGRGALTTQLMHTSGQWLSATMPLESLSQKSMNDVQAQGASLTYARRYALTSMLGLVADEDTDAANRNPVPRQQPAAVTDVQIKTLHALGTAKYGDGWEEKRKKLVIAVTKGRATFIDDLYTDEAQRLINGMKQ